MLERAAYAYGWTISLLILPVILIHEAAHLVACVALRVQPYEVFYLPYEDRGGIECWAVWHETTNGYRDIAITLAPLTLLPVGFLIGEVSMLLAGLFILAGWAGIGDILQLIHLSTRFTVPVIDFDDMTARHSERVTMLTFNEPDPDAFPG